MEQHVQYSNALHSYLRGRGSYLVGPLARFNLNFSRLPEIAQQAARDCGLALPCRNPFRSIVVRAVEMVFACYEALRVIAEYEPPAAPRVEMPGRAGVGWAATEAPRGLLYHRYEIDERGIILLAKIVPPTSCVYQTLSVTGGFGKMATASLFFAGGVSGPHEIF